MAQQLDQAVALSASTYTLSPGGAPKVKRPIDIHRQESAVDIWAKAVWIINGFKMTSFHYKMDAIRRIRDQ